MLQRVNPALLQAFQAVAGGSGNISTSSVNKSLNAAITGETLPWGRRADERAARAAAEIRKKAEATGLICQIVGDGSFMCAAPSSAIWVASKYNIPILTIILNNGGKPILSTPLSEIGKSLFPFFAITHYTVLAPPVASNIKLEVYTFPVPISSYSKTPYFSNH